MTERELRLALRRSRQVCLAVLLCLAGATAMIVFERREEPAPEPELPFLKVPGPIPDVIQKPANEPRKLGKVA